jgi:Outer membrane protein beta-barrel domain
MSSEKRFDDIENKIKEAAENNHIVFEEESWKKMEVLLDKEDKRKPFFLLWFLVPIALVSAYSLFKLPKNNDKLIAKNIIEKKINKNNENINNPNTTTQIPTGAQQINVGNNTSVPDNVNVNNNVNTTTKVAAIVSSYNKNMYAAIKKNELTNAPYPKKANDISTNQNNKAVKNYLTQNKTKIKQQSKTKTIIQNATTSDDETVSEKPDDTKTIDVAIQKKSTDVISEIKKDSSIIKNVVSKKEKRKSSKILSRFYLLGAAGADVGSVKLFSFGNSSFNAKYGASIGYSINKRLNVQAGFYTSNKKYIAGPKDYTLKAGTYLSTVPITKVEAACLIYELPINLQYHFLQKKSFSVYAGAGISSYIMKKEDYNYFYKRYNMDYSRAYTYTGNQHLFSNAVLSAGIEKNFTKKIAIQLEPAISIPLKGVGDGEVKLFSTALLLGIKYKPFNK